MWIEIETPTKRLYDGELMDKAVTFSENGTAQVSDDVGERLCEHYDTISTTN